MTNEIVKSYAALGDLALRSGSGMEAYETLGHIRDQIMHDMRLTEDEANALLQRFAELMGRADARYAGVPI